MAYPSMKLYITASHFIIQTLDLGAKCQLVIDRESGRSTCCENFNPLEHGTKKTNIFYLNLFFIAGVVQLKNDFYLIAVTEADIIGNIKDSNIYTIRQVRLLQIKQDLRLNENNSQDLVLNEVETEEVQNLSKLLSKGFYFSYYFDLTRKISEQLDGGLHGKADQSYYWNFELYKYLATQGVDPQWFFPIIQGYVGINEVDQDNMKCLLALISRRSCDRTGTRYNCRGLDDDGNVANYVETEQILIINNSIFSVIQVRGSVPLFWEQTGVTASLNITRGREMNRIGLKKHIEIMTQKYGTVLMLNLLSKTKSEEKELSKEWEILNGNLSQFASSAFYFDFDFHQACNGSKFNKVNDLVYNKLYEYLKDFRFFMQQQEIVFKQRGVVRTNCLDCLDRTNVMQYFIGWAELQLQMEMIGYPVPMNIENAAHLPLCKAFKELWAINGDKLSVQYTGTGSTITSITKSGKKGFKGMISHGLATLGRFYKANVEDADRQKCIENLLRKRDDPRLLAKELDELKQRKNEYTRYRSLTVRTVTWNLAGKKLLKHMDFSELLGGKHLSEIIILAFEECVKLNTRNILQEGNNKEALMNLEYIIKKSLDKSEAGYTLLCKEDLVGISLFIYCKNSLNEHISRIDTDTVKVGLRGKIGNKGAVACRFSILDTSFCVLACHIESGSDNYEQRLSQLEDIQTRAFQQGKVGKSKVYRVESHDVKFLMGDLNFRINLTNTQVRHKISQGEMRDLLNEDQLISAMREKRLDYKEAEIRFYPTYKFDFGTNTYDSSKKQRTPAWCDRVLYKGEKIECFRYGAIENNLSSHRAVFGDFQVVIEEIDEALKKKVEEEIILGVERKPQFVDLLSDN